MTVVCIACHKARKRVVCKGCHEKELTRLGTEIRKLQNHLLELESTANLLSVLGTHSSEQLRQTKKAA